MGMLTAPGTGPLFMLRHLGAGRPFPDRTRLAVTFLTQGRKAAG